MEKFFWLRTKTHPRWYIHELKGACYVSWVSEADKAQALSFSNDSVEKWAKTLSEALSDITGFELEIIEPFA